MMRLHMASIADKDIYVDEIALDKPCNFRLLKDITGLALVYWSFQGSVIKLDASLPWLQGNLGLNYWVPGNTCHIIANPFRATGSLNLYMYNQTSSLQETILVNGLVYLCHFLQYYKNPWGKFLNNNNLQFLS